MESLGTSRYKNQLVVDGSSVFWYVNDGLAHKRTFNFDNEGQPISQALFTVFTSTPHQHDHRKAPSRPKNSPDRSPSQSTSPDTNIALVVVLKNLMHVIFLDGGSYIIHLPFPVLKVWPISIGLLLERQLDVLQPTSSDHFAISGSEIQLPRLFTLSNPLEDFGMVTCNRSSHLDPNEEIVFISPQTDTFCVTNNVSEKRLTLWYASPDQQARRKVFLTTPN